MGPRDGPADGGVIGGWEGVDCRHSSILADQVHAARWSLLRGMGDASDIADFLVRGLGQVKT